MRQKNFDPLSRFIRMGLVALVVAFAALVSPHDAQASQERVIAQWSNGYWYPGWVTQYDRQRFFVQFDDGDTAWLTEDRVRPFSWGRGTRVDCRWQGGNTYYSGMIADIRGDTVVIHYDDGDRERTDVVWCRANSGGGGYVVPPHIRDSSRDVPSDPEEFLRAIERNRGY